MTQPTLLDRLSQSADELLCRVSNGKVELVTGISKRLLPEGLWGHAPDHSAPDPTVYLTFDDGPHPATTPALLDLLDRMQTKATFFLVGSECEKYPHLVERIHQAGHTLGNHSYSHVWLPMLATSKLEEEIVRTNEIIEDITGTRPHVFRPPFGFMDQRAAKCLKEQDMTPVYWGIAPEDWQTPGAHRIIRRVMWKIADGTLIVLHEGSHLADQTITAASEIIAKTRLLGYQFAKVNLRAGLQTSRR
jgi:peptidoglycan/xylan/chitin deacetylase (PgdA/CDA1 family)